MRNEQKVTSNEQKVTSNEQRAKSNEQRAKSNEQRAKSSASLLTEMSFVFSLNNVTYKKDYKLSAIAQNLDH